LDGANILIVEDERIVAMEIESYLSSLGYTIKGICSSANEAYQSAIDMDIDLILMDIYLIDSNGIEAASRIKAIKSEIPIIFLTAHMDENTIEQAIAVNPAAYLIKPFNRNELSVAIKIALKQQESSKNILVGDMLLDSEFSYDSHSFDLICCGEVIGLSKKERRLLQLFLENKNRLLSNDLMEYELWPDSSENDSRRRTLVSRLRTKLKHKFIETSSSEGYIFRV
jgi:DNA-binding response OmpR family regulator